MRAKLTVGAVVVAGITLLLSPSPMRAHHAFAAEFDEKKPVKFADATVTKVKLINPHSWIYVDVKQADGTVENWAIEAGSPNILLRRGITKDYAQAGGQDRRRRVSVEGRVAPGKRQGPQAAERATAVPRIFRSRRRRSLRSAAARRGHEVERYPRYCGSSTSRAVSARVEVHSRYILSFPYSRAFPATPFGGSRTIPLPKRDTSRDTSVFFKIRREKKGISMVAYTKGWCAILEGL